MYKLEFTLKQHTPLIHFQPDQDGATLRASEVKPKLDRFIIEKLGNIDQIYNAALKDKQKKDPQREYLSEYEAGCFGSKKLGWLRGESNALNYQLKVIASNPIDVKIRPRKNNKGLFEADYPFLLANMGGKEDASELMNLIMHSTVKLIFCSDIKDIIDQIEGRVDSFFAVTNFGHRQSKGFGCFYRYSSTLDDFREKLQGLNDIVFEKKINQDQTNHYEIFKSLDKDYKILKSGLNQTESKLKAYFEGQYNWEKVGIKSILKGQEIPENTYYLRILLGLADVFEYKHDNCTVQIEQLYERDDDKISRFRSPITFKIFNKTVFAFPEIINEDILDQNFKFTIEKDGLKKSFTLRSIEEFNIGNFLKFGLSGKYWKQIESK